MPVLFPSNKVLPYIIKDFIKEYPKVSFSINNKNSQDIVDDIIEGRENFGIVGAKYRSRMLDYIDFYEDELVLAVHTNKSYPLLENGSVDIEILLSEKFIFRNEGSGTRRLIEQKLSQKDISLDDLTIVSLTDSNIMIKNMIEQDLGVSFISQVTLKNEIDLGLIKALKVEGLDLSRSFYFVYNKGRTLAPVVEVFKNFLYKWPGIKD